MLMIDEDRSFEVIGDSKINLIISWTNEIFWLKTLIWLKEHTHKLSSIEIVSDAMMHMWMIWDGILGKKLGYEKWYQSQQQNDHRTLHIIQDKAL